MIERLRVPADEVVVPAAVIERFAELEVELRLPDVTDEATTALHRIIIDAGAFGVTECGDDAQRRITPHIPAHGLRRAQLQAAIQAQAWHYPSPAQRDRPLVGHN